MRPGLFAVLASIVATTLAAQQPAPPPAGDTARPGAAPAAAPSADQRRFLEGLRTVSRGIAQLKDGIGRVTRARAAHDSVAARRAARFLAGLCGSARAFLRRGRSRMSPAAYADSARWAARRLVAHIDTLAAYLPACEHTAAAAPDSAAAHLAKRLGGYDAALRDFRAVLPALPRSDTIAPSSRQ
jgi:hypothetical protein